MAFVYNTLMQPGATIQPGGVQPSQHSAPPPHPTPPPSPAPTPPPQQASGDAEPAPWQYRAREQGPVDGAAPQPPAQTFEPIRWEASEFVAHDKTAGWYMVLAGATLLFMGVVYLITHDEISTLMIAVIAVFFGILASRKPRVLEYALDEKGLTIANKFYPYADFKSFSVINEGGLNSIIFMPMKRFMPLINIYYPPEHEREVVNALALNLPRENRSHDLVERAMSKIRF